MKPSPETFTEARKLEQETGNPQYLVRIAGSESYVITPRMPMVGEWYTSDQLRHG